MSKVTHRHPTLQRYRLFLMLDRAPRIKDCWDESKRENHVELFERELGVMGSGEKYLAQFFAAVWFYSNERYGFDLVNGLLKIDASERQIILDWMAEPFWP